MPDSKEETLAELRQHKKSCLAQKNWQGALEAVDRLIAMFPTAEDYQQRGLLLLQLQRYPDAVESFSKALAMKPELHQAFEGLTRARAKLQEPADSNHTTGGAPSSQLGADMPQSFGRYQMKRHLGCGGMGAVYLVYDTQRHQELALKTVLTGKAPLLLKRFAKEAKAMAKLSHPNIVKIYDVGEIGEIPYFTMDFIQGTDLDNLAEQKKISIRGAVEIVQKVALTIHYAHSKRVLHRDIKPSNIMVTPAGEPIVMDFGLALDMESNTSGSHSGIPIGTPAYMSPEQVGGKRKEMDERCDVYSLGALLYKLLTGLPPFQGLQHRIFWEVLSKDPTPPSKVAARVPLELDKICLKAMAKEKSWRYQTAEEFAQDLERFLNKLPVLATLPGVRYKMTKWIRRNKLVAGLAGFSFTLAVIAMIAGFLLWKSSVPKVKMKTIPDKLSIAREYANKTIGKPSANKPNENIPPRTIHDYNNIYSFPLHSTSNNAPKLIELNEDIARNPESASAYAARGLAYAKKGQLESAIAAFDKAVQLNPKLVEAYVNRGTTHAQIGNTERARADYYKAIALDPASATTYNNLAALLQNSGDLEGALCNYEKAIGLDPCLAQAYYNRGVILYHKGDKEGALANYDKAMTLNPGLALTYMERGVVLAEKGELEKALADFNKAIELDSKIAKAYANRGVIFHTKGNQERALAEYDKALALEPGLASVQEYRKALLTMPGTVNDGNKIGRSQSTNAEEYNKRGLSRYTAGDMEGAIEDYNLAIAYKPNWAEAYNNRGQARYGKGDREGALADYNKALSLQPDLLLAYDNRARLFYETGDPHRALADCDQILSRDPKFTSAYNNRSLLRLQLGDVEGAYADCTKTLELDPKYASAYNNLGQVLAKKGNVEGALAAYNQAIAYDPKLADAYNNLGTIFCSKGDIDRALCEYNKAIQCQPKFAGAYHNRAIAEYQKGDFQGALTDSNLAIQINPGFTDAYNFRGCSLLAQNKVEEALADFTKAIQLDSQCAVAYRNRATAWQKKGDHLAASLDFRRYLELVPDAPDASELKEYIKNYSGIGKR